MKLSCISSVKVYHWATSRAIPGGIFIAVMGGKEGASGDDNC